jgi:hypothetical protein
MNKVAKRLAPSRETLREIYLKSGNNCAFPRCDERMFNSQGNFVGQICHIEAAETGGERFNQSQTNEQRRAPSNLLLLCYPHHKETNDVSKYPVSVMQKIKLDHENRFSDVVGSMLASVTDHTDAINAVHAQNLGKTNRLLDWKLSTPSSAATAVSL